MRISDWSSDVCSSDLEKLRKLAALDPLIQRFLHLLVCCEGRQEAPVLPGLPDVEVADPVGPAIDEGAKLVLELPDGSHDDREALVHRVPPDQIGRAHV